MWSEVRKMKGRNSKRHVPCRSHNDCGSTANMFSDKYKELYNSVSYDAIQMKSIEPIIMARVGMNTPILNMP